MGFGPPWIQCLDSLGHPQKTVGGIGTEHGRSCPEASLCLQRTDVVFSSLSQGNPEYTGELTTWLKLSGSWRRSTSMGRNEQIQLPSSPIMLSSLSAQATVLPQYPSGGSRGRFQGDDHLRYSIFPSTRRTLGRRTSDIAYEFKLH